MTRDEWKRVESSLSQPEVQLAMEARCEEQGHQLENGADFFPFPRAYLFCKWCGRKGL